MSTALSRKTSFLWWHTRRQMTTVITRLWGSWFASTNLSISRVSDENVINNNVNNNEGNSWLSVQVEKRVVAEESLHSLSTSLPKLVQLYIWSCTSSTKVSQMTTCVNFLLNVVPFIRWDFFLPYFQRWEEMREKTRSHSFLMWFLKVVCLS